jgi:hypothetical protein
MRILLIIVLVLGLLLTGLSICGIRVANEHRATDRDVHQLLARLAGPGPAHNVDADALEGEQEASIEDIELIKRGWLVIFFAGPALFIVGIVGIIIQKRAYVPKVVV